MKALLRWVAPAVADLKTERLRLVAIEEAMLQAEEAADGSLARHLRATVTPEWPPEHWEPHVLRFIQKQFEDEPHTLGWHRYMLLPQGLGRNVLIGCLGAFPRPRGEVEIGYSTLPAFQRRGYATEAVNALIKWLLLDQGVRAVTAQTFPHLPESIKVMERCGMQFAGAGDEPGAVLYRREL